MPLPRFQKLDEPRKKTILDAAAEEFGERGFEQASYNRIIERAGISKGAMYYYFSDKDDLYRTVLDHALAHWLLQVGFPFEADDAASFWNACEAMYARSLRFMLEDPKNAALCLSVAQARERLEGHPVLLMLNERMMEWTGALVSQGQALGAVREDLPTDLIVHAALALMDAGDRWLASHWSEITADAVDDTASKMVDLFRRVGEPEGAR
ncbi:MAG: TetR/AcrR family transcriptional regulator [Sandaracinaceae bacterium]|nr:TetR/AcrR family transcriptional regulator [Sandaracinaceae bacterium]